MNKEEALKSSNEFLHLIGKKFKLPDGETETVKTVVAWEEEAGNWQPHVCFYEWGERNPDGVITHMNVEEFNRKYHPAD